MSTPVYHYDEQALSLLAIIFAPGFIHLGSQAWVHALSQELDWTAKKILDFGSGAGGPACALAQQDAQVIGIETSEFLLSSAQALAAQQDLSARTEFTLLHDLPWSSQYKVDGIISINTLSHFKEKNEVLAELNRVLRSNGTLVLMDWFHKSPDYSAATQAFFQFTDEIFYLNTAQDYLQNLEKNKFNYVNFKDATKIIREQCEATLLLMKTEQENLVGHFGAEYYEWWLEYWQLLNAALLSGDLLIGYVKGLKI